ncbi:MAG: UDP-N-acetylmuramoyl-tripeptide--D-alanyl-D-alanine ligase [Betaproteobacteria bacterium]
MMELAQALRWLPGAVLHGNPRQPILRVHSDTRSLRQGDLFVAIRGDTYDANQFLAQAKAAGAAAALCSDADALARSGLPGIVIADTRQALGDLACGWRAQFTLPLIAVTGSNGKTTVTQMLAAIVQQWHGDAALATQGNFNNDIGLPLTLLRLRESHHVAVVELGMNHPGEIARLAAIARPTVALVNNAQREHLEFMATVEAVARENGAVIEVLAADGTAVFPQDDTFAELWRKLAGARRYRTFSITLPADPLAATADVHCMAARWLDGAWQVQADTPEGPLAFTLHMAGRHNVHNALAAATSALAAGVPLPHIAAGLQAFEPVKGRSRTQTLRLGDHCCTLVDDSYNANPDSVDAAIAMLATLPAPRLLVLGDMGEVGEQGPLFHAQAGERAHALGIDSLFTLGALSNHAGQTFPGARHFDSMAALADAVRQQSGAMASILVKGSRFMQMEKVVETLVQHAQCLSAATGDAACC